MIEIRQVKTVKDMISRDRKILTFVSISISFVELNLNFSMDTQNDNIHFYITVVTFERSHVK